MRWMDIMWSTVLAPSIPIYRIDLGSFLESLRNIIVQHKFYQCWIYEMKPEQYGISFL